MNCYIPKTMRGENNPLFEYEQARYNLMTKVVSMAYAALNKGIEDLGDAIMRGSNKDFDGMDCLSRKICEFRISMVESFERENNTSLSNESKGVNESEPTIF